MKKFISTILIFSLISFLSYSILVVLWGNLFPASVNNNLNFPTVGYGHTYSRMADANRINDIDVLIVGSSHAYRGFDTRIFEKNGLTSFNLGTSNQTPIQTYALLKTKLNTLNPKLVVFEVYPNVFTNDGVESSLDLLANDKISFSTLKWVIKVNHIKTYNAFIFGLFNQLFRINKNITEPTYKLNDTYISGGGYVKRDMQYYSGNKEFDKVECVFNKKQFSNFKKSLSYLKKNEIKYILVQAPVTNDLNSAYKNKDQIDSIFASLGPYINFNDSMNLNDTVHFFDADHLNQAGVNQFNDEFLKIIMNKYF